MQICTRKRVENVNYIYFLLSVILAKQLFKIYLHSHTKAVTAVLKEVLVPYSAL